VDVNRKKGKKKRSGWEKGKEEVNVLGVIVFWGGLLWVGGGEEFTGQPKQLKKTRKIEERRRNQKEGGKEKIGCKHRIKKCVFLVVSL